MLPEEGQALMAKVLFLVFASILVCMQIGNAQAVETTLIENIRYN